MAGWGPATATCSVATAPDAPAGSAGHPWPVWQSGTLWGWSNSTDTRTRAVPGWTSAVRARPVRSRPATAWRPRPFSISRVVYDASELRDNDKWCRCSSCRRHGSGSAQCKAQKCLPKTRSSKLPSSYARNASPISATDAAVASTKFAVSPKLRQRPIGVTG